MLILFVNSSSRIIVDLYAANKMQSFSFEKYMYPTTLGNADELKTTFLVCCMSVKLSISMNKQH